MPLIYILGLFFLISYGVEAKPLDIKLEAKSALLINADSGKILFSKNPHEKIGPASTTKILTALVFIEAYEGKLDKVLTAQKEALGAVSAKKKKESNYTLPAYYQEFGGTHVGIKTGEQLTVLDLVHALLIPSANDAANVLAMELDGTVPQFVDRMNRYVQDLGCQESYFLNPHGLFHPEQLTSASDLCLMARKFIAHPLLKEISSKPFWKRPQTNLQKPTFYAQNNALLRKGKNFYPYATGIKTGYISASGYNLVASAENGQRNLILALLGEPSSKVRFEEAKKIFDMAFNEGQVTHKILTAGVQDFETKVKKSFSKVQGELEEDLLITYFPSEKPDISAYIDWKESLKAPIKKGDIVGEVIVKLDGVEVKRVSALSERNVSVSFFYKIEKFFKKMAKKPVKSLSLLAVFVFIIGFIKVEFFPRKKK